MSAAEQVQYETSVRVRYAGVALLAAVMIVASQLVQLSGVHAPVNELTLDLIAANQRRALDTLGAVMDMIGLGAVGVLLFWLHRVSAARRPDMKALVRYFAAIGAGLAAVMALAYTVAVADAAHQFVTTGNQGYPEAERLTSTGAIVLLPLLLELGTLLLAVGVVWTALSAMRVGLTNRMVGYAGVFAGALFIFPISGLVPIVQGYWLAAMAVLLAGRWPSGDPPAWTQGVAVPWVPVAAQQQRQRPVRGQRGQRGRRVSDDQVMAVVEQPVRPANPRAGRRKRKRHS
ncbi:MAG: hypothetical protein ACP5H2_03450 [Solirubrobacteraceae bacterium]